MGEFWKTFALVFLGSLALVLVLATSLTSGISYAIHGNGPELCEQRGLKYQYSYGAPGYKMCYLIKSDGIIVYSELKGE